MFSATIVNGQSKACPFDSQTLQFAGTPTEQARCLLRKVEIQGAVGDPLKKLPQPLEKLIGQPVKIDKVKLRLFLKARSLDEKTLGGSLDSPLSTAKQPNGALVQALYF
ncbi:MAG: hypothetical protein ABI954_09590, partial [Pyrinomonadaceae bacterium]